MKGGGKRRVSGDADCRRAVRNRGKTRGVFRKDALTGIRGNTGGKKAQTAGIQTGEKSRPQSGQKGARLKTDTKRATATDGA